MRSALLTLLQSSGEGGQHASYSVHVGQYGCELIGLHIAQSCSNEEMSFDLGQ
ncbi:hypothetical protein BH10PSE1_BH10PSE1_10340 [soil metagenome]